MQDLKNIETAVLLTMIAAHSSYYAKSISIGESKDCFTAIAKLQAELNFRKDAQNKLLLPVSHLSVTFTTQTKVE